VHVLLSFYTRCSVCYILPSNVSSVYLPKSSNLSSSIFQLSFSCFRLCNLLLFQLNIILYLKPHFFSVFSKNCILLFHLSHLFHGSFRICLCRFRPLFVSKRLTCYFCVTRTRPMMEIFFFIVVPCMLFQSLLYCSNSCTSLHFKTLKSHTKTLKIRHCMFRSPLKPSSGGPWPYFAMLLNWKVVLHLL